MLSVIFFALTYYLDDFRENNIQNSCIFKIIRFNRNNIMCSDYGLNKKYCNIIDINSLCFLLNLICNIL